MNLAVIFIAFNVVLILLVAIVAVREQGSARKPPQDDFARWDAPLQKPIGGEEPHAAAPEKQKPRGKKDDFDDLDEMSMWDILDE